MHIHTACPLDCPDACSISVEVDGDGPERRIVSIGAGPSNGFTDGWICAKVRGFGSRVYSPERITTPLQRVGPKGSGEFRPLSWPDAINAIRARMRDALDAHGPDAIAAYLYNSSSGALASAGLTERLFRTLGATHVAHTICAATTGASWSSMYDGLLSADPLDVVHSDLVVVWGANPNVSNSHLPPLVRAGGADVVVVDPRRTPMAAKANQHLAITPGTDVALALSVAHVLERDDLLDGRFLEEWCDGADEYLAAARQWSPEVAADVCGIDVSEIEQFASRYASASRAVIRLGWGLERNANGGSSCRAVQALPALAGKFGVRGGGMIASLSAAAPLAARCNDPEPAGGFPLRRSVAMHRIGEWLNDEHDPTRVLFVQGANPAVTCPDQSAVMRGLAREDVFTIVHEQVLTDTARFADIVLPAPTHFEVDDLATSYGSYTLQPIRAVIDRVGESRSNDEVASAIAVALGLPAADFDPDPAKLIDAFITDGLGAGPRVIRQGTVQFVDTFPDRRVQLVDIDHGAPRFEWSASRSREIERFPLVLLTPATSKTVNSMLGETPSGPPIVHLNSSDAASRGVADGDWVIMRNDQGSINVRCRVGADVRTGVCWMGKGFWPRDFPDGMSVNSLCPASSETTTGGACFNDTYVEVTRSA